MSRSSARRASRGAFKALIAALASLPIASCAVGPDFKTPAAPRITGYGDAARAASVSTPGVQGGEAQRFVQDAEIPADWWNLFHSPPLNALIDQALAHNHDLMAARAALTAAREAVRAQRGAFAPNVSAGFSATHQKQSDLLSPAPNANTFEYSLFTPQLTIAYTPDVFGLNRRGAEAVKAQEQAVRFQMIAARVTLANTVAATAIQAAALRAQIDETRRLIAIDSEVVDTLKYQLAKGYAGGLDLAAQESQGAATAATLPPLVRQLAQQEDLLAVLTGAFPGQAPMATPELSSLVLPVALPLSLPSNLVAQRPDVLQAQANLHAASAQIGVAVANRLPNIQLTANGGSTALALERVFAPGTNFWGVGAAAMAPIFDGGTLLHQERGARAAHAQASEQYQSTVLTAFQNVADTLSAIQQDAEGLKAAAAAADAAKVTLDLSDRQWRGGYASHLALLSAEQAYGQARLGLIQAQANRYADTAALFQALGGGWWGDADLLKDKDER